MKVISNSSILIGLSAIGRLELLHQRFSEGVIVPDAVWKEVVETGHGRTGAVQVANAEWIFRQQIQNNAFTIALQAYLDQGEAEVIALGQEIGADLLLLEEKSARSVAVRLQQPVLGTVGVLIWAKRKQIISSLSSELALLRQKGGFHVSKAAYEYALEQAGE
jgi:predicted nucleic acid-binding protein